MRMAYRRSGALSANPGFVMRHPERDLGIQCKSIPACDESRYDSLVATRRNTEEIDDRFLHFIGFAKPPIIDGIWILPHESVVDCLLTLINLAVHLALVVIPDPASGFGKKRS